MESQSLLISVLILLHLMLLTFWLGADLGTFYSSRYVSNKDLTPPQRLVALKIMAFVDMAPRICMVLFLPSGISLIAADPLGESVEILGISLRGWPLVLVWAGSLFWLALVIADHHYGQAARGVLARKVDTGIRVAAVVGLVGFGLYAALVHEPFGVETNPKWLGAKVALYGVAIACGLAIRVCLRPFSGGLQALLATGSTPTVEDAVGGSIKRAEPFVLAIWVLVIVISFLGVAKPGAQLENKPTSAPSTAIDRSVDIPTTI
jgi:hypothetical protein